MPTIYAMNCPCKSSNPYHECCEPLHLGKRHAKTPEELMRSRYAAYAKKKIDYIIKTTDPDGPIYDRDIDSWKRDLEFFAVQTCFTSLTILEKEMINDHEGTVTFFAGLMSPIGEDKSFTEKSLFKKKKGLWYYHSAI